MISMSAHINRFIVQEMSNGTGDNTMLSCTVQTYFFLRHSLHNTGNGFIWFLVFLIKSKGLKEKVFLLHFTFFFCTFVFHKLYFPKLKMGTGQIWTAMSSKKFFTKRQAYDLFHEFYRWPIKKVGEAFVIWDNLTPRFKMAIFP